MGEIPRVVFTKGDPVDAPEGWWPDEWSAPYPWFMNGQFYAWCVDHEDDSDGPTSTVSHGFVDTNDTPILVTEYLIQLYRRFPKGPTGEKE